MEEQCYWSWRHVIANIDANTAVWKLRLERDCMIICIDEDCYEIWDGLTLSAESLSAKEIDAKLQKLEIDPTQPKFLLTESGVGYRLKV